MTNYYNITDMKKTLLFAIALGLAANTSLAENKIYFFNVDGADSYGNLSGVSENGKWAVGADNINESGGYYINVDDPSNYTRLTDGELYDVSNDGVAVGAWYDNKGTAEAPVNYHRGAIYKDGEWSLLPVSDYISNAGRYYARCVSKDGKYIGGMMHCKNTDATLGAMYYPVMWEYNEATEEYDVHCYNDMILPDNQGFVVNDISEDGTTLVGYVISDWGESTVPAMCVNGELKLFNKLEWKIWYLEELEDYYYCGFIDGVMDGMPGQIFHGTFSHINSNYVFGCRSIATDVDEQTATGTVTHHRTIYNLATGEFLDEPSDSYYTAGIDPEHCFFTDGIKAYYMNEGRMKEVKNAFSLDCTGGGAPSIIYNHTPNGKVLVGSYLWFNEAIGEYCESPALIVLDEPLSGISAIETDRPADGKTYDLMGRTVNGDNLAPGLYIRDGKKFMVK